MSNACRDNWRRTRVLGVFLVCWTLAVLIHLRSQRTGPPSSQPCINPCPQLLAACKVDGNESYHPWAELLNQSLEPFEATGITLELLAGAREKRKTTHILIINNTLYVESGHIDEPYVHGMLQNFQKLLCRHTVPDVEFILAVGDSPKANKRNTPEAVPLMGWSIGSAAW